MNCWNVEKIWIDDLPIYGPKSVNSPDFCFTIIYHNKAALISSNYVHWHRFSSGISWFCREFAASDGKQSWITWMAERVGKGRHGLALEFRQNEFDPNLRENQKFVQFGDGIERRRRTRNGSWTLSRRAIIQRWPLNNRQSSIDFIISQLLFTIIYTNTQPAFSFRESSAYL